ncbi:MAG: DUF5034 domain-containing protein [bacterium]
MKIKKLTILILLASTAQFIVSCCDCVEPQNFEYTYDNFIARNIDNSGIDPIIAVNDSIPKEAYGIRLEFSLKQIIAQANIGFSFSPRAYAWDCFCPPDVQYLPKDTISSIVITTTNDFDNQHPKTSEVTELFKVLSQGKYITINDYTNHPGRIYYDAPVEEIVDVFLITPPEFIGEHSFKIDVTLSDSRVFSFTTKTIYLK